jgi:hypothetical protein
MGIIAWIAVGRAAELPSDCSVGGGLPLLSIRATVVTLSEPGSVQTMCSLAASGFRMEGGETHDGSCSPAPQRECGAARATPRCDPVRAVHLLSHGQVRVLAASAQTALV